MKRSLIIVPLLILTLLYSCKENELESEVTFDSDTSFTELSSEESGLDFFNKLTETEAMNYFDYPSIYMGGGVAVGDINNDGLDDLFFTGNQVKNGLYLNKGNLKFEDISLKSGVQGDNRWYTGVSMVDINADGWLDIYCSVGGINDKKSNQLFLNNKDNTFTDKTIAYGLSIGAPCTQGVFFDFDNDGDLDLYQGVYPLSPTHTPMSEYSQRAKLGEVENSNRLMRNNNGVFEDVTKDAGMLDYSFTLGIIAADLDDDGLQDLYVSNDYATPDAFYHNNGDGTFTNVAKQAFRHTAFYGMGVDVADVNNDGHLDIFQVDMDSDNNRRQKANMASMNQRIFYELDVFGFQRQHMQNAFQLNSGYKKDGVPQYSNVSRITGTSSTDWSWGPLFADFDNDGLKDLFVTNGTRREVNNKDYFKNHENWDWNKTTKTQAVSKIPSERIDNFIFRNNGDLNFQKANKSWNLEFKAFSTGGAYADLDNDGDLELIVCNVDEEAVLFKNNSTKTKSVAIRFNGPDLNPFAIGTKIKAYIGNEIITDQVIMTRGFQSSVAPKVFIGKGKSRIIDKIEVIWPDGKKQTIHDIKDDTITLDHTNASLVDESSITNESYDQLFNSYPLGFPAIKHVENTFDDYQEQVLLPHKMSQFGPALAIADINNDGIDDFYIGGSYNEFAAIYVSKGNSWEKTGMQWSYEDRISEDTDALFIDVDMDGDLDLYVVSGGNESSPNSVYYKDRLFINDGTSNFSRIDILPASTQISGGKVIPYDYNKDGKVDLVVLGRHKPWNYPSPVSSIILKNEGVKGKPKFIDVTSQVAPQFKDLGMVTDALVTDFDNDGWNDLIIVGEWMPIKVFKNTDGKLKDHSQSLGLTKNTTGWWWSVQQGDFDNDGDMDYILGNNGLNYKYKATPDQTFDIYASDFDGNNRTDIVLGYFNEGKMYPVRGRECSSQQVPGIKSKYKNYDRFSLATLEDVYTKEALDKSLHYQVKSFSSVYLENKNGKLIMRELPRSTQISSITSIVVRDFNRDGKLDVLTAGNLYVSEVETPRNDASYGSLLLGDGNGNFKAIAAGQSGLFIPGDVKGIKPFKVGKREYFVAFKNDDFLQFFEAKKI